MDRLILVGALLGLTALLLVGNCHQQVFRKPRDPLDIAVALLRKAVDRLAAFDESTRLLIDLRDPQARGSLGDDGQAAIAVGDARIVLELGGKRQRKFVGPRPVALTRACKDLNPTAAGLGVRAQVALAHRKQVLLAASAQKGEALETFIRTLESRLQSRTALEPEFLVVLRDETAELAVGVLQRLDKAEDMPTLEVDSDVLESFGQARGTEQPIAIAELEREVDTRHQVETVEDYERSAVVDERNSAGFQSTALLFAGDQLVELLLSDEF